MKFKFLKTSMSAFLVAICFMFNIAHAGLIELTWSTSLQSSTNWAPSSTVGENLNVIFTLDNGSNSLINQTWQVTDFVSYSVEGGSGWSVTSNYIDLGSSGVFSTDISGLVSSVGNWYNWDYSNTEEGMMSWRAGPDNLAWWNNGANGIAMGTDSSDAYLTVNNVSQNQLASSWSATIVQTEVPEPSTLAIFALAMIGLAARQFKKQS
jgi:hypothetical protein